MSYRAGSRTGGKRRDTHRSPWYKETMDKAPKQTLKPTPEYLKLVSSADILNTGEDGTTTPPPRKLFILSLGSTLTLHALCHALRDEDVGGCDCVECCGEEERRAAGEEDIEQD